MPVVEERKNMSCKVDIIDDYYTASLTLLCYAILFCVKIGQKVYPCFGQLHCK